MEKLNWKKILIFGLPILFAVSLAITLAACMAEAGRDVGDSIIGDSESKKSDKIPVTVTPDPSFSEGLTYVSRGDGTCTVSGLGGCREANVTVPEKSPDGDTVTHIGTSAFLGSTTVRTVTLPDGLKSIGDYAFYESSIESVIIPSSVESIGEGAFSSCRSLRAINVDSGNSRYSSLEGVLFSKDKSRIICYPSGKQGEGYTIRYGVSVIEPAAFLNCVYLESVSYNGQQKDWDKIRIGANNTSLTSLTVKFLNSIK